LALLGAQLARHLCRDFRPIKAWLLTPFLSTAFTHLSILLTVRASDTSLGA